MDYNRMDSSLLPQRLRESSFRRFELVIATAVDRFPALLTVDPKAQGYAPVTYAARLRDAMLSLQTYHWTPTTVNMEKFLDHYEALIVSHRESLILVGSREALRGPSQNAPLAVSNPIHCIDNTVDASDLNIARALCDLAAKRQLAAPLHLIGLTREDAQRLEQNFDCELKYNNDGSFTLI